MNKRLFTSIIFLLLISCLAILSGYAYNRLLNQDIYNIMNKGFYLNGDKTVTLSYGQTYNEQGFTAIVDDKSCAKDVKVDNNINLNKLGNYEVTYTMTHENLKKTIKRYVNIIDDIPPTINLECDDDTYLVINSKFEVCKKYEVKDNYDNDLNDKVLINNNVDTTKKGDYQVTYAVSDSSGNQTIKTVNVHVRNKSEINYIVVYISKQMLYYYENNKVKLSTPITSGRNNATRTGNFKIRKKARNTTLKGKDYESKVQYWMAYDGNNFGIHDASWRRKFGGMDYKWNGSHGCINIPTSAAAKLYSYVEVGTPVYIKK